MINTIRMVLAVTLAGACLTVAAQDAYPKLGKLWLENQVSNPEGKAQTGRMLVPLPDDFYKYADGKYQSILSRITVAVPVIGNESVISVRESVIARRPNGFPITSHVLFVPGAMGMAPSNQDGVSAIVVTLLRDDRPKDGESVLSQFEPPNEGVRAVYAKQGVDFSRVKTNMGDGVQRVIRNRLANEPFPYKVQIRGGSELVSIGVTRYVVAPNDSLLEFSQVVPCTNSSESDCRQRALDMMQKFMTGVSDFLLVGNAPSGGPAAGQK